MNHPGLEVPQAVAALDKYGGSRHGGLGAALVGPFEPAPSHLCA